VNRPQCVYSPPANHPGGKRKKKKEKHEKGKKKEGERGWCSPLTAAVDVGRGEREKERERGGRRVVAGQSRRKREKETDASHAA